VYLVLQKLVSVLAPAALVFSLMGAVRESNLGVFPPVTAPNLEKKIMSLPQDFSGDLNLVLVAFERDQQREADSWLEAAPELFKKYPGIPCYEIPTLHKDYRLGRFFIDRGMRSGISDTAKRAHTITLYIDKVPFEQSLKIPDEKWTAILLVNRQGNVRWRGTGLYTDIKGNSLKAFLKTQSNPAH
jgi:hypothetical protein